jgi:hypothetical protein
VHLGHHPLGKPGCGGHVGQPLERAHDAGEGVVPGSTCRALLEVGPEGSHAESLLVVEEEIDLFGE